MRKGFPSQGFMTSEIKTFTVVQFIDRTLKHHDSLLIGSQMLELSTSLFRIRVDLKCLPMHSLSAYITA